LWSKVQTGTVCDLSLPNFTGMKKITAALLVLLIAISVQGQAPLDSILPLRGFCIAAPQSNFVDSFVDFIAKELAPRKVNTLILRVDFNYQFESHPELRDNNALSRQDIKKIVAACKAGNIRVIPQINLLGHQSWAKQTNNLLRVYPELDETPHVKMPAEYKWPNADSLYCKSYCPLHPKVHGIVFKLVDEICEVFEADAFHAGMDEVFYIGDSKCPRCKGKDKAVLFAGEVTKIRDHLAVSGRELWIWGDRLLDGDVTGLGMWEASRNGTHPAIDMIPKDVMICDWHYERADKTAVYFAMKGLRVATCPWRNPALAVRQVNDMVAFRQESTPQMKPRFRGMVQTVWSGANAFVREFYENKPGNTPSNCFRELFDEISNLEKK
jgi:hypothetical protein